MLDIHRLKIFASVAELKSFSRAANALYLTQPTVSQHITALEKHLDLVLFDRTGREISLTKAGKILYRYARQIRALQDEAQQSLEHFAQKKSGHIVLGASTIPGEYILPPLLGEFKKQYPLINITLKVGDTEEIVEELLGRGIELGVVGARIKDSRLHYRRFLDDELVVAVPRGHRWWNKKNLAPEELDEEPFIIRERGSGTRLSMENYLRQARISPDRLRIIAEMGSTTAVKQAVKAGLGITLISGRAVEEELKTGVLRRSSLAGTKLSRTFFLVTDRKKTPSPLGKALLQFLPEQKG